MTLATANGLDIRDRRPASILVMWALARLDMNCCSVGGRTWSAVPITDQDGIVFHCCLAGVVGAPLRAVATRYGKRVQSRAVVLRSAAVVLAAFVSCLQRPQRRGGCRLGW